MKAKLARQLGMLLFTLNPQATVLTVKGNDGSFVPHVSLQVSFRVNVILPEYISTQYYLNMCHNIH